MCAAIVGNRGLLLAATLDCHDYTDTNYHPPSRGKSARLGEARYILSAAGIPATPYLNPYSFFPGVIDSRLSLLVFIIARL